MRTQHLEPTQEGSVLLPEGEAVPPESGQLNKTARQNVKLEGNLDSQHYSIFLESWGVRHNKL